VHRSQVHQLCGEWREAIEAARRAASRVSSATDPQAAADARYQEAEIHRLRGELAAAEASYLAVSELGGEPQPGLALLRLAQGRPETAAQAIRRAVEATAAPLLRARFLPAAVEIALGCAELGHARAAGDELTSIAAEFDTEVLGAMAAHAAGAVKLAEGDASGACEPLRRAFRVWRDVGAPYVAARIRVTLAAACRALGDEDGARFEIAAARTVFERLGAAPDLAMVDALAAGPSAGGDHPLTPRELQVLQEVASGKTNKAIARHLRVSERTIDRHLSNIFAKLGLSSRAAATAYAYEHALVRPGQRHG
jgi:DNA-binding CsgD family transcriptional regulator